MAERIIKASDNRMLQGTGGPSFCWICDKQLQRAPGKGRNLFYFWLITDKRDPDQLKRRIHGGCMDEAIKQGYKDVSHD